MMDQILTLNNKIIWTITKALMMKIKIKWWIQGFLNVILKT